MTHYTILAGKRGSCKIGETIMWAITLLLCYSLSHDLTVSDSEVSEINHVLCARKCQSFEQKNSFTAS
jgi:hypothetical protein